MRDPVCTGWAVLYSVDFIQGIFNWPPSYPLMCTFFVIKQILSLFYNILKVLAWSNNFLHSDLILTFVFSQSNCKHKRRLLTKGLSNKILSNVAAIKSHAKRENSGVEAQTVASLYSPPFCHIFPKHKSLSNIFFLSNLSLTQFQIMINKQNKRFSYSLLFYLYRKNHWDSVFILV